MKYRLACLVIIAALLAGCSTLYGDDGMPIWWPERKFDQVIWETQPENRYLMVKNLTGDVLKKGITSRDTALRLLGVDGKNEPDLPKRLVYCLDSEFHCPVLFLLFENGFYSGYSINAVD